MRPLLLSVLVLCLSVGPAAAQTCGLPNDVTGDRAFDFDDPKAILVYLFLSGPLPPCLSSGDINGDGTVDLADAVAMSELLTCTSATVGDVDGSGTLAFADVNYLLEYLFLGGPAPVPCLDVADVNDDGDVDMTDALALVPELPCPPTLVGDANGDEVLDTADIEHIGNYLFTSGPPPVPCLEAGDANEDGVVSILDMVFLGEIFGAAACAEATLGDANGNGVLEEADILYILEYLFEGGPDPVPCVDVADFDEDGEVDMSDAIALGAALCAAALPGDANASGFHDVGDLMVVTSYLFFDGPAPKPCVLAGDFNKDGKVDIADMIGLLGIF